MLPWLMERGEVPLAEVARHFRTTPDEVAADLELAAMCGLPPFVDELIDVFIDDDVVVVGVPRLFTRPLRLTAPEGFALVAAGRAAMELPGADPAGPLGRGLQKLAAALGDDGVVVELPRSEALDDADRDPDAGGPPDRAPRRALLDAVAGRGHRAPITPRQVFHDRGEWYVAADDERSGERRTFRIDRMESVEPTGEFGEPDDDGNAVAVGEWFADGGLPRVTLRLSSRRDVGDRALPGRRGRRRRSRRRRGALSRRERALARAAAAAPRPRGGGRRPARVATPRARCRGRAC